MRVNIVMLANTKDDYFFNMTNNALKSLYESEQDVEWHVWLIETQLVGCKSYIYPNLITIHPNCEFNYNKFLNIAFKDMENYQTAKFTGIFNNDVVFSKNWFSEGSRVLVECSGDSFSPLNPGWMYHQNLPEG